jgi:hypothetical protein
VAGVFRVAVRPPVAVFGRASGGAAHRAGAAPHLRPLRASNAGRPGPARRARGATGGRSDALDQSFGAKSGRNRPSPSHRPGPDHHEWCQDDRSVVPTPLPTITSHSRARGPTSQAPSGGRHEEIRETASWRRRAHQRAGHRPAPQGMPEGRPRTARRRQEAGSGPGHQPPKDASHLEVPTPGCPTTSGLAAPDSWVEHYNTRRAHSALAGRPRSPESPHDRLRPGSVQPERP